MVWKFGRICEPETKIKKVELQTAIVYIIQKKNIWANKYILLFKLCCQSQDDRSLVLKETETTGFSGIYSRCRCDRQYFFPVVKHQTQIKAIFMLNELHL